MLSRILVTAATLFLAAGTSACVTMPSDALGPDFDLCAQNDVVTSVKLQPSELSLAVGETAQLTATLNNGEMMLCTPQTFWLSSNANSVWVSRGGVRANAVGKSYISARAGGKADSVLVTVR